MPADNLLSNWAHMVMASLAWTLKAWFALLLPERGRGGVKYEREKGRLRTTYCSGNCDLREGVAPAETLTVAV